MKKYSLKFNQEMLVIDVEAKDLNKFTNKPFVVVKKDKESEKFHNAFKSYLGLTHIAFRTNAFKTNDPDEKKRNFYRVRMVLEAEELEDAYVIGLKKPFSPGQELATFNELANEGDILMSRITGFNYEYQDDSDVVIGMSL